MATESTKVLKTDKEFNFNTKYLKSFISGGIAGAAAKSVIAPFDRIKTLFMVSTTPFTYRGALNDGLYIYREQGIKGLWKGNLLTIMRIFPYSATQFASFDFLQHTFSRKEHTNMQRNVVNFLCGSSAGIISTVVTYPLELLRTRLVMEKELKNQQTLGGLIKTVYQKEGPRAFYNGLWPSILGIIPYHGTGFLMYHMLKNKLREDHPDWKKSKIFDFLFGAIAGATAQLVSYPFDVVRKKMQAQNRLIEKGELAHQMNMLQWFKQIAKVEGYRAFYKGITMNLFKGPMASGISFTVKNIVNRQIDSKYTL